MTLNKMFKIVSYNLLILDEIVVPPASVQNKSPKMEMSNLPESLHITEMIQQAPGVRDHSTKGEFTQLIE